MWNMSIGHRTNDQNAMESMSVLVLAGKLEMDAFNDQTYAMIPVC
jgi:hypothetical protein